MKKMIFPRRGARREEGMALIFALGFLALMLILGLGFVTTSLLAQKLAANNSSRAQARMFARSAAARAMLNIMLYNDQATLAGKTIENYDAICSYDKVDYNDGSGSTVSDGELSDQLRKYSDTTESKLKYQPGGDTYYSGEDSNANWLFFYDSPKGTSGRRIIGRAAYQVLPRQAGRLSLYTVTGGSKVKNDYGAYPHEYRWGRDIAELDLEKTQFKTVPGGKTWYTEVKVDNIPNKFTTLYTSYNGFFPSSDAEKENTKQKKRWIEYWFAEGRNPILKDAFPTLDSSKVVYFNRFNISDYYYDSSKRSATTSDNWYDRFRQKSGSGDGWGEVTAELKNSDEALNALAGKAVEYKENHSTDLNVAPSGLPFLKRIGNEKWSFESLEMLRRQIAANFNDYCDADSIPTSNVKASEWSITDSGKCPNYTGNEKSLYINEVAAELSPVRMTYDQDNYALQIKEDVKFKLWVELINMYDNSDSANSGLLDPANMEVTAGVKPLSFKYTMTAKYTGTVRFTYRVSGGPLRNGTANFTVDVSADATIGIADTPSVTIGGDKFSALTDGYSIGSCELTPTVNNPATSIFTNAVNDKAREAAEGKAPAGSTIESVTITITQVIVGGQLKTDGTSFELQPMKLATNKAVTVDGSDVPSGTGLDFVRFDRLGVISFTETPPVVEARLSSRWGWKPNIYDSFFIGGIEVRDPRQNLNPRPSGTEYNSDWKIEAKLLAGSKAKSSNLPSMTIETGEKTVDSVKVTTYELAGGKVNSDGSPSGRETEGNGDKETATDPAWLGDGADKHVSTAYIRNAPMVSPWEIGLIHRGREWQTLNLKRAGGFGSSAEVKLDDIKHEYPDWTAAGTEYKNGDGAILEFIKVGINCRSMGKIPLKLFKKENIGNGGDDVEGENKIKRRYNKDIIRMLFDGVRVGQTMKQFYAETYYAKNEQEENARQPQGGTSVTTSDAVIDRFINEVHDLCLQTGDNEFRMRSQFINSDYGAIGTGDNPGSFSFGLVTNADNDALREEIIGKTVNLLTVDEVTPPNVFRMIVVAQSIRDVGGIENDVTITKLHKGEKKQLKCQIGRFDFAKDDDWENNTYFDEITGEVKALVTIERVPSTDEAGEKNKNYGRMVVTGIEFIE